MGNACNDADVFEDKFECHEAFLPRRITLGLAGEFTYAKRWQTWLQTVRLFQYQRVQQPSCQARFRSLPKLVAEPEGLSYWMPHFIFHKGVSMEQVSVLTI